MSKFKLSLFLLFSSFTINGQINLDSLWNVWSDPLKPDTSRLLAINRFAWDGYLFSQPDSAYYFAGIGYDFAKSVQLIREQSNMLNIQGVSYAVRGQPQDAIDHFEQALSLIDSTTYFEEISSTLNNLGNTYSYTGNLGKAIEIYSKSFAIYEELEDEYGLSSAYNNIGIIYHDLNEYDKALEHFNKSLEISRKIGDEKGVLISLGSIGDIYFETNDLDSAFNYYNNGLTTSENINDFPGISRAYFGIGKVYSTWLMFDSSLFYLNKAYEVNEEISNLPGTSNTLVAIAGVYQKQEKFNQAIQFGKEAYDISIKIEAAIQLMSSTQILYQSYQEIGQYKLALTFFQKHIQIRDSINSEANQKKVIHQEYKLEYEKKEAMANAEHMIALEKQETKAIAEKKQKNLVIISISIGLILVGLFLLFIFNRLRVTKKQKDEIALQKEVIEIKHKETETQKHIIETTHKEITDSINYAKRLQNAILPSFEEINKYIPESFVLLKPKDVVSGDFYWFEQSNGSSYIAAADCTGHGVPGAMVSVICNGGLNRSIREFGLIDPGEILDKTKELVIKEFMKSEEDVNDGMDIALCKLDGNRLSFSGANNPLWIIRNQTIIELKPNKQPVGKHTINTPFTTETIELQKGDAIYLFSDGYSDQFGGTKGKKYKSVNFKAFLISIQKHPIKAQKALLDEEFNRWKGNLEQIDDVCVIGIKIK